MTTEESAHSTETRTDGDDPLAQAMLALNEGRHQDAEEIAAGLLTADAQEAGALYVLGCALIMQGRAGEAIAALEAAAAICSDPAVATALAIALRHAGRLEEAANRLERAVTRDAGDHTSDPGDRKSDPGDAAALLELGRLMVLMDRHAAAIDALTRGLAIAPDMPELSVQLGYAHLSRGDCGHAKAAFAKVLEISPGAPDALFGMAKAHQEIGENEEAAKYFRRYLAIRPDDAGALLSLGHCLLELGRSDAGYDCFRQAASGGAQRYGNALTSLAAAARGRFWLRPSQAARFLRRPQGEAASSAQAATEACSDDIESPLAAGTDEDGRDRAS
jgi:tetratricopeptide (TPR) repeat protein